MSDVITSKIKQYIPDELMALLARVCDTRQITDPRDKMKAAYQLLNKYGVKYNVLGDATNRLAVQIDAYAFKIALDKAGYLDNWSEYMLTAQLQPYVTMTYETNGYVAIAQCVRSMTADDFRTRYHEMSTILDNIGGEYLLGDVGLTDKTFKNWGIDDDGKSRILDYAYIHRASTDLFICPNCGGGMLTYNPQFTALWCKTSSVHSCGTTFTYEKLKTRISMESILSDIEKEKSRSYVLTTTSIPRLTATSSGIVDGVRIISSIEDYNKYVLGVGLSDEIDEFEDEESTEMRTLTIADIVKIQDYIARTNVSYDEAYVEVMGESPNVGLTQDELQRRQEIIESEGYCIDGTKFAILMIDVYDHETGELLYKEPAFKTNNPKHYEDYHRYLRDRRLSPNNTLIDILRSNGLYTDDRTAYNYETGSYDRFFSPVISEDCVEEDVWDDDDDDYADEPPSKSIADLVTTYSRVRDGGHQFDHGYYNSDTDEGIDDDGLVTCELTPNIKVDEDKVQRVIDEKVNQAVEQVVDHVTRTVARAVNTQEIGDQITEAITTKCTEAMKTSVANISKKPGFVKDDAEIVATCGDDSPNTMDLSALFNTSTPEVIPPNNKHNNYNKGGKNKDRKPNVVINID